MLHKLAMAAALPLLAACLDKRAEQDHSDAGFPETSKWRCGHSPDMKAYNAAARVVELREGSLDWIRSLPAEVTAANQPFLDKPFSKLFCADYLKGYKNPESRTGYGGVCVRNGLPGETWRSIVETDEEVRKQWAFFGTSERYQLSVGVYREDDPEDMNVRWGSGSFGPVPDNWCAAYMKQMLCHIAFPQYAGRNFELTVSAAGNTGRGNQGLVRPVCSDNCVSILDICNRMEPDPYKMYHSWLVGFEDPDQSRSNEFFCEAWNNGYGLAQAGTGVGAGSDDNDKDYCAEWESASSAVPAALLLLLSCLMVVVF